MSEQTQDFETMEQSINIGIEQILASILETLGDVVVPIDTILKNYGDFAVAVNQDLETKALTFRLTQQSKENNDENAQAE
jgi:hypothetical protein